MTSPALEINGAIVPRLKSWSPLTALVGDRVYDNIPANAVYPYVVLGPSQEIQDDADCLAGTEVGFRVEGWSKLSGRVEILRIGDAIKGALHQWETSLTDNALVFMEWMRSDWLLDQSGTATLQHIVCEFRAVTEQP